MRDGAVQQFPCFHTKRGHYPQLSGLASHRYFAIFCTQTQYYVWAYSVLPRVSTIGTVQVPKQTVLIHLLATCTPTLP